MDKNDIIHGVYSDGDGDDWNLELEFDTDSFDFVRGFQIGQIWELLDYGIEVVETVIYAENSEMAIRVAESRGYDFSGSDTTLGDFDGDFIEVKFVKKKKRKILHPDKGDV